MSNLNLQVFKAAEFLSDEMVIESANALYEGTNEYIQDQKMTRGLLSKIALKGNQ